MEVWWGALIEKALQFFFFSLFLLPPFFSYRQLRAIEQFMRDMNFMANRFHNNLLVGTAR